jgi:MFS family permease
LNRRHIFAVTIGNALEFYDFLTYAFFSAQIGRALFPPGSAYASLMLSLLTFGAGFLTRPVGAIVIGAYSDRVGRKPAMLFCFALIGGSIIMMALIPPYARIGIAAPALAVVARMAQGFSLGGELGSNTAYLAEAASPDQRGLVVSWQCASQLVALAVASCVGVILSTLMEKSALDAYGWRIAFLIGAVTLPFGLWLRTNLPETLHLSETSFAPGGPTEGSRLEQARRIWPILAIGLVVLGCQAINNYGQLYLVTYAQETLGMSATSAFWGALLGFSIAVVAALLGGALSDRIGRKPVNLSATFVYLLFVYPIFAWIIESRSDLSLVIGTILLTVLGNIAIGAFYASLAELLPKTIRGSAFGTIYAVALAVFGGSTQLVVTWLIHVTGSPYAPAWFLLATTALWGGALTLMPESAPRRLARTGLPLEATM